MPMNAIEVSHISKSYGKVKALDDVSFSVGRGEVFGLIGPDGAGKTSMFRILSTLLLPDQGTATVDGFNTVSQMRDIRRRVGYMPGRFSLYQDLTVRENLEFFATLFGTTVDEGYDSIRAIYSQIERFGNRKAGALSGGMKQKLALSCALVHSPSVLFLDEPTTGVDPVSRKEFWDMLSSLKERGKKAVVEQRHKAESDIAVAAASVVAREQFLRALCDMAPDVDAQAEIPLGVVPKGSSDPRVREVAERMAREHGPTWLMNHCKAHFQTTDKVLAACGMSRADLPPEGQVTSAQVNFRKKEQQ